MDATTLLVSGAAGLAALAVAAYLLRAKRPPQDDGPDAILGVHAQSCLEAMNWIRVAHWLPPLMPHHALNRAALDQAFKMGVSRRLYHGVGGTLGSRVTAAGCRWTRVSENIVLASKGGAAAVRMWMASEGNRRNILNEDYLHVGVGSYGHYYCAIFAVLEG